MTLIEAYRNERRKSYNALTALFIARHKLREPKFDWDGYRGQSPYGATLTRDNFDIVVRVDYEQSIDLDVTWTDHEWELPDRHRSIYRNPNGSLVHDDDTWHAMIWRAYNHSYAYCVPQAKVCELADWYHRTGASRSVALDTARENVREVVELYAGGEYTEYVISVTAYRAGVELGRDFLGGVDITDEPPYPNYVHVQFEDIIEDNGMIASALSDARDTLRKLCAS